jgi:hypothetical protein
VACVFVSTVKFFTELLLSNVHIQTPGPIGGISEGRHDIHTKFHKDWFRHSKVAKRIDEQAGRRWCKSCNRTSLSQDLCNFIHDVSACAIEMRDIPESYVLSTAMGICLGCSTHSETVRRSSLRGIVRREREGVSGQAPNREVRRRIEGV